MAKSCTTFNSLNKEVMRRVNVALRGEVNTIVRKKLEKHIRTDVLRTYTPKEYKRRGEHGIEGAQNIVSTVENGVLRVRNEAKPDTPRLPGYTLRGGRTALAKLIEHGANNPWNGVSYVWTKPRRFVSNTQQEINDAPGAILRAIEKQFPK